MAQAAAAAAGLLPPWLRVTPAGLWCEPGGFFVDPVQPVERAVLTHGHADHARAGHAAVLTTAETAAILRARWGAGAAGMIETAPTTRGAPSAGSASRWCRRATSSAAPRWCWSMRGSASSSPATTSGGRTPPARRSNLSPCDVFVTEATFGLPVFRHPPDADEIARLLTSLRLFPDRAHLIGVYALGKCQRLTALLRRAGWERPIYLHGALLALCDLYVAARRGAGGAAAGRRTCAKELAGEIVLCPPSAIADRWTRRLPRAVARPRLGLDAHPPAGAPARRRAAAGDLRPCRLGRADRAPSPSGRAGGLVTHGREEALVHYARTHGRAAARCRWPATKTTRSTEVSLAMQSFATLLDALVYAPQRNAKLRLIGDCCAGTSDPDRGFGLAALTGELVLAARPRGDDTSLG